MLCLHDSRREDDPSLQGLLRAVENAPSLTALLLATWQVARVLTVHLPEAVLAERARPPPAWPPCPACMEACSPALALPDVHRSGKYSHLLV